MVFGGTKLSVNVCAFRSCDRDVVVAVIMADDGDEKLRVFMPVTDTLANAPIRGLTAVYMKDRLLSYGDGQVSIGLA